MVSIAPSIVWRSIWLYIIPYISTLICVICIDWDQKDICQIQVGLYSHVPLQSILDILYMIPSLSVALCLHYYIVTYPHWKIIFTMLFFLRDSRHVWVNMINHFTVYAYTHHRPLRNANTSNTNQRSDNFKVVDSIQPRLNLLWYVCIQNMYDTKHAC